VLESASRSETPQTKRPTQQQTQPLNQTGKVPSASGLDASVQKSSFSATGSLSTAAGDGNNVAANTGAVLPLNKQALCVDILTRGYVNSFVDFFYLTHLTGSQVHRVEIPDQHLSSIQNNLIAAEKAHRRNEPSRIIDAYEKLAMYFQECRDYRTAVYFYEKCSDIAESTGNLAQQCVAANNLGVTYDAMGNVALAARFHEKHLQLALQMQDEERVLFANKRLLDVYRRFAEQYEENGDIVTAIEYYKKFLQCAVDCHDSASERMAVYRLGLSYAASDNLSQAVYWQLRYLELCRRTGDQLGEGAACAALAMCHQKMNDLQAAAEYLQKYAEISGRTKQLLHQVEAHTALGLLASGNGQHTVAVEHFRRAFEIARQMNNRRLTDAARFNLGMAQGNATLPQYFQQVSRNSQTQLGTGALTLATAGMGGAITSIARVGSAAGTNV